MPGLAGASSGIGLGYLLAGFVTQIVDPPKETADGMKVRPG